MNKVTDSYKQVVIVRTDLDMGKGKIAAQVAHASVNCVLFQILWWGNNVMNDQDMVKTRHDWLEMWVSDGNAYKIVLRCKDLNELDDILLKVRKAGLPWHVQTDRGYTQIPEGTTTCIAIGPAPTEEIDKITGHLKLL